MTKKYTVILRSTPIKSCSHQPLRRLIYGMAQNHLDQPVSNCAWPSSLLINRTHRFLLLAFIFTLSLYEVQIPLFHAVTTTSFTKSATNGFFVSDRFSSVKEHSLYELHFENVGKQLRLEDCASLYTNVSRNPQLKKYSVLHLDFWAEIKKIIN